jgi:hypothetical protein
MEIRPPPLATGRSQYPVLRAVPTRWMDNDHYGHVNNVAYYSFFDTAVNGWLIEACGTDIRELPVIGIVAETSCRFLKELSFPEVVHAGLRSSGSATPASSTASGCSAGMTPRPRRSAASSTSTWMPGRAASRPCRR